MWKGHLSIVRVWSLGALLLPILLVWFMIEETVANEMKSLPSTRSIGWPKSTITTPVNELLTFVTTLTPDSDETLTTSPIPDIEQSTKRYQSIQSTQPTQYRHQQHPFQKLQFTSDDKQTKLQLFANDTLQPEIFYSIIDPNNKQDFRKHLGKYDDINFDLDKENKNLEEIPLSFLEADRNRQSTIEKILSDLFPHGLSDIFRYSQTNPEQNFKEAKLASVIKNLDNNKELKTIVRPKKEVAQINGHGMNAISINNLVNTQEVPIKDPSKYIETKKINNNNGVEEKSLADSEQDVRMSTTVTREYRRETSPGHMEIVIEKIISDPKSMVTYSTKQNNSKRAIEDPKTTLSETIALPTLLYNKMPMANTSRNFPYFFEKNDKLPVVVLPDADFIEDFEDVDEDDNQLAESKTVSRKVYRPPSESTHYQNTAHHDINIHIIHDDNHSTSRRPAIVDTTTRKKFYFTPASSNLSEDEEDEDSDDDNEEVEELPRSSFRGQARIRTHQFFGTTRSPLAKIVTTRVPQKKNEVAPKKTVTFYSPSTPIYTSSTKVTTPLTTITEEPIRLLNSTISNSFTGPTVTADITFADPMKHSELQQLVTQPASPNQNGFDGKSIYRLIHPESGDSQSVTPINVILVPFDSSEDLTPEPLYPTQLPPLIPNHMPMTTIIEDNKNHQTTLYTTKKPATVKTEKLIKDKTMLVQVNQNLTQNHSQRKTPAPFTFVEVQKSINIHNKLIKEQGGKLLEERDVFFTKQKSKENADNQSKSSEIIENSQNIAKPEAEIEVDTESSSNNNNNNNNNNKNLATPIYGQLTKNPINVSGNENESAETAVDGEVSASFRDEQVAYAPSNNQEHVNVESIHHSEPIREIHTIEEVPNNEYHGPKYEDIQQFTQNANSLNNENYITNYGISSGPSGNGVESLPLIQQAQQPFYLQGIIEKHIPIPYSVPAPVPVPVAIDHYIDRPYPVETIVEKPVPYPVEKIIEKVVEKRVPIEVERIVEKPIEKIVRKYVNRPYGIPIKVPVAIQFASNLPTKYLRQSQSPSNVLSSSSSNVSPWSISPVISNNNLTPLPFSVVRTYYNKMLKKLMPPTANSYKSGPPNYIKSRPTAIKPYLYKSGKEFKYDLKPPPPSIFLPSSSSSSSSLSSSSNSILTSSLPPANLPKPPIKNYDASWDKGARYQYEFNSHPHDLMAAQSLRDTQQGALRNALTVQKENNNNFDEFLRWRNGHQLKRSPELGRNLQVEYGFKPPLIPSIEIDDRGIPLKKNSAQ